MPSHVHEIDPVTVELEVQVPWDRVRKGLDATYGKLQKTARVRGFRPGKVPRNVIKQLYGPQVHSEVVATLVEEGLIEAVQQHSLALVATPQVDSVPAINDGEPLSFKAKLEVRPKVDAIDTANVEIVRPLSTIADDEVEAELAKLRDQYATRRTPDAPRPARENDTLTIDYTVEIDAEERADMAATDRPVELGGGRLLPEFEEGLLGKQPGDEVEIRIAYGDDVPKEDLKGKRALFRVKVKALEEKVLPELDDAFAKEHGGVDSVDALRAKIRSQLEDAARDRAQEALREQVVEKLIEKNPIPVPPSLVAQQEQLMRRELAFLMQMTGGQQGSPLLDEMERGLRDRAEKKVRAGLLMGELAKREKLDVSAEDIDKRLAQIAEQTGKHIAKVRVEYSGERRESLESKILEEKLLEYLLAQATVTDAPPGSAAAEGASTE